MSLLRIENLTVHAGDLCLLAPTTLQLNKGERLTILGETGAGKSLLAQAIMGSLPAALSAKGLVQLEGVELTTPEQKKAFWGKHISILPQEPWNALDPLMPVQRQLSETYQWVGGFSRQQAEQRTAQALDAQGLSASSHKRIDQLSGGMAQRIAIACATAGGAPVLLADEPTKGLDVSRRDQVVQQLMQQTEQGALLTITHDVAVARQIGGRILIMKAGEVVESGDSEALFANPQHDYTRTLLATDPKTWSNNPPFTSDSEVLLSTEQLNVGRGSQTFLKDLSINLHKGEVIGVVGDSGCGKSTLGDTLLGLLPTQSGKINRHDPAPKHRWQKLYQDPTAAISHAVPLRQLLDDVVKQYKIDPKRIPPLMQKLGLNDSLLARHADAISGGELQRFCMLRVLLLDPVFLFADEPTSRLDPITTKSVSALLVDVARETKCCIMLVSHDPDLIEKRCDQVVYL